MRTLIDIPDSQIKELTRISKVEKRSRASLIREAVGVLLELRKKKRKKSAIEAGFGLWGDYAIDGVEYQRKIRSEW